MAELTNEMLRAIIVETVDTMPEELLAYYRNPPGRRPPEHVRRIQTAIADMDDAIVKLLIRDIVDRAVFGMLYLTGASFKDAHIATTISRGALSESLADSVLHEEYRLQVDPGGTRAEP